MSDYREQTLASCTPFESLLGLDLILLEELPIEYSVLPAPGNVLPLTFSSRLAQAAIPFRQRVTLLD